MVAPRSAYGLFDALERVVDVRPDAVALRCGSSMWSFEALRDRAVRLGNAWRTAGVGPGDRVAVLADNCHRYVEIYWACAYLGAITVPLERRLGDDELRALLADVTPAVVAAGSAPLLDGLRPLAPGVTRWVDMGDGDGPGSFDAEIAAASAVAAPAALGDDHAAAVYFTAAVEGRPRGAVVTHRNLLAQAVQTGEALGLGPDDAQGLFLPLSHTFGGYLMYVAACRGVGSTLLATFDPEVAAGRIAAGEVTFFAGFAPMPARIADAAGTGGTAFPAGLRLVVGLDGPASIRRYQAAGVRWMNFYGQTETAGLVVAGEVDPAHVDPAAVGVPLALTRLSFRDAEGVPVAPGEAGEAWVRSDVVVERYWPDEPTRLTDDGWLRTGDVLMASAGQRLRFIGRTGDKDLVKPGGLNVYPAEVEALLTGHPAVARAWVFGLPDPEWNERVCAVVVPTDPDSPPDPEALRAHCRAVAARYKCPRAIVVTAASDRVDDLTRVSAKERYAAALDAVVAAPAEDAGLV